MIPSGSGGGEKGPQEALDILLSGGGGQKKRPKGGGGSSQNIDDTEASTTQTRPPPAVMSGLEKDNKPTKMSNPLPPTLAKE